jgi:hypothetical protein
MSDRGYVWFAFGEKYIEASERLAASIKKHNRYNKICVITDNHWLQLPNAIKNVDTVELFEGETKGKFEKEWQVFKFSPFTHSIKLEADMIFTENTDWWWNYLEQWDMVHSYNCRNYKDDIVKTTKYRKIFEQNGLPNVYSGLHYFRKSIWSMQFYIVCKRITTNWEYVRDNFLINCFDKEPTTDVVYALANKMLDPLQITKVDYDFFKFVHNKNDVNGLTPFYSNNDFLQTYKQADAYYLGGYRQSRIWHYHDKDTMEKLDAGIL